VGVLCESGRVTGVRTACGQTVHCGLAVDASGSRTWLSRQLGLRTYSLSPPFIAWRVEMGCIPDGMSEGSARFQEYEDGWLFQATWRGRTTSTAIGRGRQPPWFLPPDGVDRPAARSVGWRLVRPVAGRGWLLAGEAAGRLDPAWGEGLVTSILSGIAAGRVAIACLTDPTREAMYLAAYDGWFADRIHAAAAGLRQRYADNGIHLIAHPAAAA
jgi:flavin-dependent dehydrogenase